MAWRSRTLTLVEHDRVVELIFKILKSSKIWMHRQVHPTDVAPTPVSNQTTNWFGSLKKYHPRLLAFGMPQLLEFDGVRTDPKSTLTSFDPNDQRHRKPKRLH